MSSPLACAVMLATGLAERMRPLIDGRPKPLLKVRDSNLRFFEEGGEMGPLIRAFDWSCHVREAALLARAQLAVPRT